MRELALGRLAGDMQAAEVSMRRAIALDDNAATLFADVWAAKDAPLPSPQEKKGGIGALSPEKMPVVPPLPERPGSGEVVLDRKPETVPETQEVTILAFTGLAPALRIENVRIWFPAVGYLLIDLPSYTRAVRGKPPEVNAPSLVKMLFHPLLKTDVLAYRTLWDEVRLELAMATSRAVTRAGIAAASYAAARSHEKTRDFAPLVGSLTTAILDIFATAMSGSVRNWETLPNTGYIAMTNIPRGSVITIGSGAHKQRIHLPGEARGVIVMVTELSNSNLKVNHATY